LIIWNKNSKDFLKPKDKSKH